MEFASHGSQCSLEHVDYLKSQGGELYWLDDMVRKMGFLLNLNIYIYIYIYISAIKYWKSFKNCWNLPKKITFSLVLIWMPFVVPMLR